MSRSSAWLWRSTFSNLNGPPTPPRPEGMSEPAWTHLLFGDPFCDICDRRTPMKPDWVLRRRTCKACSKETVTALIPPTSIGFTAFLQLVQTLRRAQLWDMDVMPDYISPYFLEDDCEDLVDEVEAIVASTKPEDLDAKLEEVRAAKAQALDKLMDHARLCSKWAASMEVERLKEIKARKLARSNDITERFVALGYTKSDTYKIRGHKEVFNDKALTDRIWTRIRPILEPEVAFAKAKRLEQERKFRLVERRKICKTEYQKLLLSQPPMNIVFYPKHYELAEFPAVAALNAVDVDVHLDDGFPARARTAILSLMPAAIDEWINKRKAKVLSTLASPPAPGCGIFDMPAELELAKNVFVADEDPEVPLYAQGIFCYRYKDEDRSPKNSMHTWNIPKLSGSAQSAIFHLLDLCGLDRDTTTTKELDALHPLFVCENCTVKGEAMVFANPRRVGKYVHTWIEALGHQTRAPSVPSWAKTHGVCRFKLLSDEDRHAASELGHRGTLTHSNWGCCYCTAHFKKAMDSSWEWGSWFTRSQIVEHLKTAHDTGERESVEGTDFYYNPWHERHEDGHLFLDMEREGENEGTWEAVERLAVDI
ncbi:uncharacterized protein STEHIDRAFT_124514 [Stereum hirsutum FP-91666 SS1]|uniref:uncharacterized protein n=1 Tax=Stereum hirsutum (strain FP-91666) TaxID=721885 RepID=UPI000444A239|nr:uncharacterized protein STEHIDRAFT_124514 [Stereum hirsutum FP-91666 SS1]EIM82370.1 hypothetical protein STEHIDRAFT_124514 [Stereum hirsutum FP-91666 SS1]